MQKSCIMCKKREDCDLNLSRRCKVWGGEYEDRVIDLLFFEEKE